jgi:hypothetical protein
MASLILNIIYWRNNKGLRPRDPPFEPPFDPASDSRGESRPVSTIDQDHDEDDDEESQYGHVPQLNDNAATSPFSDANRARPYSGYSAGSATTGPRASVDNYGAFNDPVPSGYGASAPDFGQASGLAGNASAGVSRTMQYADPYAAVRASIAGSAGGSTVPSGGITPPGSVPAVSRPNSGAGPFVPSLPYVPSVSPFAASQPPSYEYTGYKG